MWKPFTESDGKRQQQLGNRRLQGHAVSKATLAAGRRIAGALRAQQARQQKRKDSR